jgi:hypothetical protein
VSEDIGNPLANLSFGIREYGRFSHKFLRDYWQLLKRAHICEKVANAFWRFAMQIANYTLEQPFFSTHVMNLKDI